MAGTSLLALIDDIATLLDDVSVMSKVAVKKTAGVLGDDLAVNAEQVGGVKADRELPVVWAVARGSFKNKFILVPAALTASAIAPWLITPVLLVGGLFLCFEGFEKVLHWAMGSASTESAEHAEPVEAASSPKMDVTEHEREKIQGAIRTDFILSTEIVVIALGTVQHQTFAIQVAVVSIVAIGITFFVYGIVAAIVKLDDAGLYLIKESTRKGGKPLLEKLGKGFLLFAPKLMNSLTVVGTIAMFLVGGGILTHGIPWLHHLLEASTESMEHIPAVGHFLGALTPTLLNMAVGLPAGVAVYLVLKILGRTEAH